MDVGKKVVRIFEGYGNMVGSSWVGCHGSGVRRGSEKTNGEGEERDLTDP